MDPRVKPEDDECRKANVKGQTSAIGSILSIVVILGLDPRNHAVSVRISTSVPKMFARNLR